MTGLQPRTHEWDEYILLKQCVATVPVRISRRGLGMVILGPCAPCTATLAVLIISFVASCVVGICKTPRPNLRIYLGFSVVLWVFHFILFGTVSPFTTKSILRYLELLLMSNGGKEQRGGKRSLWDIPREKRKVPLGS